MQVKHPEKLAMQDILEYFPQVYLAMMLFQFVDDNGQHLWRLLLLMLLIQFHNSICECHILFPPVIVHQKTLPVFWPCLLSTHNGFYPTNFWSAYWLPIWPWGLCPLSPTRTALFVRPWRVSWPASFFIWEAQCNTSICVCFLGSLHQFAAMW